MTGQRAKWAMTSLKKTCKALAPRPFQWVEGTDLMGSVRPQTPHRSPRQAFGGNFG